MNIAKPKIMDSQNGIKSIDNNNKRMAKTLKSIVVSYLEASRDASPI